MFFPKVDEAQEKAFSERLFFINKLREIIENTIIEVPKQEIVEQGANKPILEEVEVIQETPIATQSNTQLNPEEQPIEAVEETPVEKPKRILTFHCRYKGKTIEIVANNPYDAQLKAVPLLKANPKKSWEISVHLVAIDGVEQMQSTVF
jgi:DNA polymerase III epsilon subunit-like protein